MSKDKKIIGPVTVAELVVKTFYVGHDGLFIPPIDPFDLAKKLQVKVLPVELRDSLSGFIVNDESMDGPEIFVNSTHSMVRQRFTVAHELGHFFHENFLGNKKFDTLRRERGHSDQGTDEKERWANSFAANLLMPGGPVKSLFTSGETLRELSNRFQVSEIAMEYRLDNLGL